MYLQAAKEKWQEYCEQIPEDTLPKMAKSALYSFTGAFLFVKRIPLEPYNLGRPLFAGGVAFLASLIYSLTTPIFNMAFGDNGLKAHVEFMKQVLNVTLCSAAIGLLGAGKVNVHALPILFSYSINLVKSLIDLIPAGIEHLIKDKPLAAEIREFLKYWKLDAPAGTGSVFINFGIFPSIGMGN